MIESRLDLRDLWKSQSEVERESVARSDGHNVGVGGVAQLEHSQNLPLYIFNKEVYGSLASLGTI